MDALDSMDMCGHVTVYDTEVNIDLYLLVSNMPVFAEKHLNIRMRFSLMQPYFIWQTSVTVLWHMM